MKKAFTYLSLIILISFLGCSDDFLAENPKTFLSSVNFYKSADDFDAALMGMYVMVRSISNEIDLREVFTDYNDVPESAEQVGDIYKNVPGDNFWPIRYGWQFPYNLVNNANMVLDALVKIDLETSIENRVEAEAKLLRAFAYFQLVQLYGDIPLRTDPVRSLDQTQIPKSSQEDVYSLIISDLTFAETHLPENAPDMGRVYKQVATALLAKVYLTTAGFPLEITANYALAVNKALEVINSGKFELMDDYAHVFHNNTYTNESIWEALFSPPRVGSNSHIISAPTGDVTAHLLPTDAFINSFPEGDRRREWGIKAPYIDSRGNQITTRTYYNKFINEQFFEDGLGPSAANQSHRYTSPIIRFAEMYLVAAEAENEMNGPVNANQYLNVIRKRARINKDNPNHVPDLEGLSQEEFRSAVLNERKWEMHIEGNSWFDLKRTQTFYKVQEARSETLAVPIGPYNNTWLIPDFEILNNNIEQNPSYGGN